MINKCIAIYVFIDDLLKETEYKEPTNRNMSDAEIITTVLVAAIMRKENLRSIIRKKFVVTTDSKHNYPVVNNILNRNFMVSGPGQVWVSDITYSVPVSPRRFAAVARAYLKYTFVSMPCCEGI